MFATTVLDQEHKTFVVYVVSFLGFDLGIYLSCRPLIADLILKKTFIIIPAILISKAKMVARSMTKDFD